MFRSAKRPIPKLRFAAKQRLFLCVTADGEIQAKTTTTTVAASAAAPTVCPDKRSPTSPLTGPFLDRPRRTAHRLRRSSAGQPAEPLLQLSS